MKQYKSLFGKLFTLAGMVCFIVAFFSCKKNDENLYLHNKQDATQTAFADENKTSGFTFTAKNSWVIFAYEVTTSKGNDVSWIQLFCNEKVAVDGRAGTFKIDIALETNYTGQTRTATIEIASGSDKILVSVTQSGKSKDGETPEPEPVVIDVTDAIWGSCEIATLKLWVVKCDSGECVEYLLASTEVAQTGYKITLPNPEDVHIPLMEMNIPGLNISNPNTKFVSVLGPVAYNKDGRKIGEFFLLSEMEWLGVYMYCDRDCNITGKSEGNYSVYAECYFKKGWNLFYTRSKYIDGVWTDIWTTEKPIGENFAWRMWWVNK